MVIFNLILSAIYLVPHMVATLNQKEYPFLKTQINDEEHAVAFNKLLNSIVKVNQKRLASIKKLTKLQSTDVYPTLEDTLRSDTLRSGPLRSDTTAQRASDDSDSDSDEKNIIYLVIPDTPPPAPNAPQVQNISVPKTRPPTPDTIRQNATNQTSQRARNVLEPEQIIPQKTILEKKQIDNIKDFTRLRGPNETISQVSISKDGLDALRVSIERSCKSREVKKCRSACKAAASNACSVYDCRKKLKKKLKKECKRECKEEFKGSW